MNVTLDVALFSLCLNMESPLDKSLKLIILKHVFKQKPFLYRFSRKYALIGLHKLSNIYLAYPYTINSNRKSNISNISDGWPFNPRKCGGMKKKVLIANMGESKD